MDLNTIIKSLRSEIKYEKEVGNDLEHINWGNQEGILVSVNDLEKLLDACDGKKVDAGENTLPIQRVGGMLSAAAIEEAYNDGVNDTLTKGYGTFDLENYR